MQRGSREEEEAPVAVSESASTRCEPDPQTGEQRCETLYTTWRQYADGRVVKEQRTAPAEADAQRRGGLLDGGLGGLLGRADAEMGALMGELGRALGESRHPSYRAAPSSAGSAPRGGQWA